jgi:hypothetical protein
VAAEILVIVMADATGDGELVDRANDRLAIEAGDVRAVLVRPGVEAAMLLLGAGNQADLIDQLEIALISIALGTAAAEKADRWPEGRLISAMVKATRFLNRPSKRFACRPA